MLSDFLQTLSKLTVLVKVEQVGRVVTFTFDKGGKIKTVKLLTIPGEEVNDEN